MTMTNTVQITGTIFLDYADIISRAQRAAHRPARAAIRATAAFDTLEDLQPIQIYNRPPWITCTPDEDPIYKRALEMCGPVEWYDCAELRDLLDDALREAEREAAPPPHTDGTEPVSLPDSCLWKGGAA